MIRFLLRGLAAALLLVAWDARAQVDPTARGLAARALAAANAGGGGSYTLPPAGSSTLGGVTASPAVMHQFLTALSTSGAFSGGQPAFSDISGLLAASQLPPGVEMQSNKGVPNGYPGLNASGVVPVAQLPSASNLGGSSSAAANLTRSPYRSTFFNKIPLMWGRFPGNQGDITGIAGTARSGYQTTESVSDCDVVFDNYYDPGSGEAQMPNPITITADLEYPAETFYRLTFAGAQVNYVNSAGQVAYTIPPWGKIKSDNVSLQVPGSKTQASVRVYLQGAYPPANNGSATSSLGGTIGASVASTYTISIVGGPQGESGPSSSIALTTGMGMTNSNVLAWTFNALSVPATQVNIYKGGFLLVSLPGTTMTWTDTGALSVGTQTPHAAFAYPAGVAFTNTGGLSYQGTNFGGTSTNQTETANTSWEANTNFAYNASAVECVPNTGFDKPVGATVGDSISDGQGSTFDLGYINTAFQAANMGYWPTGRPGEYTSSILGPLARMRANYYEAASDVVSENGINDTINSQSLAGIQANEITSWQRFKAAGVLRVWRPTLTPYVKSTDQAATTANQSPGGGGITAATNATPIVLTTNVSHGFSDGSPVRIIGVVGETAANISGYAKVTGYSTTTFGLYADAALQNPVAGNAAYTSGGYFSPAPSEVTRKAFNLWVLDGAPMNPTTLAPVATGTPCSATVVRAPFYAAGVIATAGCGTHLLAGTFNPMRLLETDVNGNLVPSGGFWPVNGTAFAYTADLTHPTTLSMPAMSAEVPTPAMLAPVQ